MPNLQVIIADDETSFARGLSEALAYEPGIEVKATASNGRDAARLAVELLPDAVLMDLDMPVMSGIEAIRQIKREAPGVEIVVMTVFDDNAHLFEALQAGAKGYLLKNASPEEVAQAVRNVTQGQAAIPPRAGRPRSGGVSAPFRASLRPFRAGFRPAILVQLADAAGNGSAAAIIPGQNQPPDLRGTLPGNGHGKKTRRKYLEETSGQ